MGTKRTAFVRLLLEASEPNENGYGWTGVVDEACES